MLYISICKILMTSTCTYVQGLENCEECRINAYSVEYWYQLSYTVCETGTMLVCRCHNDSRQDIW